MHCAPLWIASADRLRVLAQPSAARCVLLLGRRPRAFAPGRSPRSLSVWNAALLSLSPANVMTLSRLLLPLLALLLVACPSSSVPDSLREMDPDARETNARENRAALAELMERARNAPDEEDDVPDGLDVVVLEPPPEGRNADGSLRRDYVIEAMAHGPHLVLGAIEFVPARQGDAPAGYQIVSFRPHGEWMRSAGFQEGDVLQRVNGEPLWEPEGFMAAWDGVPESEAIEVTLLRQTRTIVLEWPIRDPHAP